MQMLVHIGLLYFVKKTEIVDFDSFGVEHLPEEIKEFIWNKNFFEYYQTIQQCVGTSALDSLILCLLVKD